MKKRVLCFAFMMLVCLAAPAYAAEEPEPAPEPAYRLASISERYAGEN